MPLSWVCSRECRCNDEPERLKVGVEAKDRRDAVGASHSCAGCIRQAELDIGILLQDPPACGLELLVNPDDACPAQITERANPGETPEQRSTLRHNADA
jgi:hypothetical protein